MSVSVTATVLARGKERGEGWVGANMVTFSKRLLYPRRLGILAEGDRTVISCCCIGALPNNVFDHDFNDVWRATSSSGILTFKLITSRIWGKCWHKRQDCASEQPIRVSLSADSGTAIAKMETGLVKIAETLKCTVSIVWDCDFFLLFLNLYFYNTCSLELRRRLSKNRAGYCFFVHGWYFSPFFFFWQRISRKSSFKEGKSCFGAKPDQCSRTRRGRGWRTSSVCWLHASYFSTSCFMINNHT